MPRQRYIGVTCLGCNRARTIEAFVRTSPRPDTPADRLHQAGYDPKIPGGTYLCPCGHYTTYPDINRGDRVIS